MRKRRMDYHLHTTYSADGVQTMAELMDRCQALGLEEICLTEHLETGHPDPEISRPPDFAAWLAEMDRLRGTHPGLIIRQGVEIGDLQACRPEILATLDSLPLDFRLLSLHLVDGQDPYEQTFYEGKTQEEAYARYVEQRLESATHFPDYDALAHLGYVAKFAPYPAESRALTYGFAPQAFDALFRHLAENGRALEVNASGYLRMDTPLPGPDLIRRFLEMGGEFFTFGSDSHRVERDYLHVERAKDLVRSLGGRWQVGFARREMRVYAI